MGNYERTYGNDKFVTKLNAKELTLKKINADTNWVDIYTTGFMLGESLDSIANLMLDPYITEVLNNFNSSVFDNERNSSKIAYIQGLIQNAKNEKNIAAENLLSFLLDRVKDAEELRILGKMLKINQGISTNTVEQFNYIKAIESFIESAYNSELKTLINESNRLSRIEREIDRQASEEGIVYPETSEKYDNLLSSIVTTLKESYGFTEEQIKDFIQNKSNYRNITFINLWNRFSLLKFIEDRNYADDWINRYEGVKRHFNILDVIDKVPHFREMFKVLDINTRILNTLSTRNHLESIILNSTVPNGDPRRKLSTDDIRKIKSAIDDHIINSWLIDKDLVISIAPHALDNVVEYQTSISSIEQIQQFRRYVESYVIPLLKEKLPNNKFIQQLIFGVKNDTPFYKLPFNMVQIDNTAKTKLTYEETLRDFNKLNNIKIDGIDMNLVDVFYLYNLIVNKDKFGPNSLTRIFEDVLASPGNEKLLVYDFNKWLDEQDPMLLAKTFTYPEIEGEDKEYYSDLDSSIGFKSEPTESDIEESQIESASDTQISNAKDLTPPITQELNQQIGADEVNKTIQTVQSDSDQFTKEERKSIKSILGDTKLKVVVASEHTDPVFHVAKIKKQVEEELAKPVKDRKFHMMYIITKHDGVPLKELAGLKIPKFFHFSITTLGGTKYEPGVMKPDDLLDRIGTFVKDGLIKPNMITIRIDPIIPGVTNEADVEHVISRAKELGIRSFKFSVMDSYGYTEGTNRDRFIVSKMKSLGYNWDEFYSFSNGKYSYNAKPEVISQWYHFMDDMAKKYDIWFNTCGEQPKNITGLSRIRTNVGCVNVNTINAAMGTTDVQHVQSGQRTECSCYGLKVDALRYDDTCASSCAYCYAKHNSDSALRYYNEDGQLKYSKLTDPYYDQVIERLKSPYGTDSNQNNNVFNTSNIDTSAVDYTIEEKPWRSDPTKNNLALRIYLKGQHDKGYFELVKDNEPNMFSVHLKTTNEEGFGYTNAQPTTKQERDILYTQLINAIPDGAQVSTWGEISIGGIKALNKIGKNMIKVGERTVTSKETREKVQIPIFQKSTESTNTQSIYYDTKPSVKAELIEKIKAADMKGLHIVYDSDLVNDDSTTRNAKGFVRNGEIYINVDRATNDTVIHEFGHLYLADAKLNHPNEYYELLSEVRKTDIWKRMRSMIEYQNKRGSDFDEEVLATIISNYYKDDRENFFENAHFAYKALDLVSPEFKEFLLLDTIPQLSDTLITNYKDQQKLATVKNQLTKDNIIKEDCK